MHRPTSIDHILLRTLVAGSILLGGMPLVHAESQPPVPANAALPTGLQEATRTDDPLAESVVRRLLDQYTAAVADREELQETLRKAKLGAAKTALQVRTLEAHIAAIRREILSTEIAIHKATLQRRGVTARRADRLATLESLRAEVSKQEEVVRAYLRALQMRAGQTELELLLESRTFAHAVDAAASIDDMKQASSRSIDRLTTLQRSVAAEESLLQKDEQELTDLTTTLHEQEKYLRDQRYNQEYLVLRTRGQQKLYEQLLLEAQEHQAEVDRELQGIVDALATIADPEALQKLGSAASGMGAVSAKGLIWPIPPLKVTTFFQDPEYRKYFGFQHEGVDLRAAQGTEVRAVADAVVLAAKDRGKGYSFVVLLHRDHLSTVYGHLSEILVTEGQVIRQGEIIGKSGGAIGSEGAGPYTTGPHLHFEVRESGKAVNPLEFLP